MAVDSSSLTADHGESDCLIENSNDYDYDDYELNQETDVSNVGAKKYSDNSTHKSIFQYVWPLGSETNKSAYNLINSANQILSLKSNNKHLSPVVRLNLDSASKRANSYRYNEEGDTNDCYYDEIDGVGRQKSPSANYLRATQGGGSVSNSTLERRKFLCSLCFISSILFICLVLSLVLISLVREQKRSLNSKPGDNRQTNLQDETSSSDEDHDHARLRVDQDELESNKASRWLVSNSKCHIPNIDAWHETILDYVGVKPKLNCSDVLLEAANEISKPTAALTYVSDNKLFFTKEALRWNHTVPCCYKKIVRGDENDDDLVLNETCITISQNGLRAPAELIKVECSSFNYTNIHSFIVHDLEEELALERRALSLDEHYYNVVVVGVDTMSRLNAYRQLNGTLELLRKKYKTIEFVGYNKVGENTFPNLIPFLSGLKPEQLSQTKCWLPSNYSQESDRGDDYLDNCSYLWNYYQEFGYVTYFSEDWPKASTFNYLKPGFKHKPTAFYGRPFTLARDEQLLPPVSMGCAFCLWDKPIVELDLNNLKSFIREHKDLPHFAFHWINCPQHDDLNGASRVDHVIRKFFDDIHKLTFEKRTFVIVFSDHGYRWNDFVSTRVGHYESSLPMLTIAAPKQFIEQHPDLYENLKKHSKSLLTPFDMFKTLIDIRNLAKPKRINRRLKKSARKVTTSGGKKPTEMGTKSPTSELDDAVYTSGPTASTTIRQIQQLDGISFEQKFKTLSLLRSHNSTNMDRSCVEAGVPDNYCVCHEFQNVDKSASDVLGAAYYLVYVHFYTKLMNFEKLCHPLTLDRVKEAEMFDFKRLKSNAEKNNARRRRNAVGSVTEVSPTSGMATSIPIDTDTTEVVIDEKLFLPNREYNLQVITQPGAGLFQEVIRFYGKDVEKCSTKIDALRSSFESNPEMDNNLRHESVMRANEVCKFSVHSDSISRLNLYGNQSRCVRNNNELNKMCFCKTDL